MSDVLDKAMKHWQDLETKREIRERNKNIASWPVVTTHIGWVCDLCGWSSRVSDCYEHGNSGASSDTQWFLPKGTKKTKWVMRDNLPQELIDLMNGNRIKVKLDVKDWKGSYGSTV